MSRGNHTNEVIRWEWKVSSNHRNTVIYRCFLNPRLDDESVEHFVVLLDVIRQKVALLAEENVGVEPSVQLTQP